MPADRPNARELIEAVSEMLEQMLPTVSGYDAFQLRIAVSLLHIAGRDLDLGDGHRLDEQRRLAQLLGRDAPHEELEAELIDWIVEGDIENKRDELMEFLRVSAEQRLRIANPRHLGTH